MASGAAIPEAQLESELFGQVRGPFKGAIADRPGRFADADTGTLSLAGKADGNRSKAARHLGLSRQTFLYHIEEHELP